MSGSASPPRQFWALVVAGGSGVRAGAGLPKQYRQLAGMTVLRRAILPFLRHPEVAGVQVVIRPEDAAFYEEAVAGLVLLPPVPGGGARQDSVRAGLNAIAAGAGPEDVVLIHDAARPLLSSRLLNRCIAKAGPAGRVAFAPALPVVDSLRRGGETLREPVDRAGLLRVQTPQCFDLATIVRAHEAVAASDREFTDDAALVMDVGEEVGTIEGEEGNFKLTTDEDFARAEALLAARRSTRTGMGFDVHAFEEGEHVWIGGIRIPHAKGLKGHSDADVALHALTDALLGAIAEGDIGDHFPPSDPQWRGAPSSLFLDHARALVEARGGRIDHVDVTIICEAPRIGPHRAAMRSRIAILLRVAEQRVSVKATTTERLGFTGRGEGIAAQAVATVSVSEDA